MAFKDLFSWAKFFTKNTASKMIDDKTKLEKALSDISIKIENIKRSRAKLDALNSNDKLAISTAEAQIKNYTAYIQDPATSEANAISATERVIGFENTVARHSKAIEMRNNGIAELSTLIAEQQDIKSKIVSAIEEYELAIDTADAYASINEFRNIKNINVDQIVNSANIKRDIEISYMKETEKETSIDKAVASHAAGGSKSVADRMKELRQGAQNA